MFWWSVVERPKKPSVEQDAIQNQEHLSKISKEVGGDKGRGVNLGVGRLRFLFESEQHPGSARKPAQHDGPWQFTFIWKIEIFFFSICGLSIRATSSDSETWRKKAVCVMESRTKPWLGHIIVIFTSLPLRRHPHWHATSHSHATPPLLTCPHW